MTCFVRIMSHTMPGRTVPWTLSGWLGCCSGGDRCSGSTSAEVMERQRLDAMLVACCAASLGPASQGVEWGAMRASNLYRISRTQQKLLAKGRCNVALKTLLVCPTVATWRRKLAIEQCRDCSGRLCGSFCRDGVAVPGSA